MRSLLSGITVFLFLVGGIFALHAQSNAGTNAAPNHPSGEHESWMISFLTPAQQRQYAKARAKALSDNPALKTDGEKLMKQGEDLMSGGSAAEKQTFIEKMNSHRQELRQAMLKVDPTLEPIFAEIDKHISEMKSKHLGQVQSSPGATNSAPANSPTSH